MNKTTLKTLKAELDTLKKAASRKSAKVSPDAKITFSKRAFMPVKLALSPLFFLFTTLLAYGHKIPLVSRAIKLL